MDFGVGIWGNEFEKEVIWVSLMFDIVCLCCIDGINCLVIELDSDDVFKDIFENLLEYIGNWLED